MKLRDANRIMQKSAPKLQILWYDRELQGPRVSGTRLADGRTGYSVPGHLSPDVGRSLDFHFVGTAHSLKVVGLL